MGQRRLQLTIARIEPRKAAEKPSEQPLKKHPNGGEQPSVEQGRPPEPWRRQLLRRHLLPKRRRGFRHRRRRHPQQTVNPTLRQREQGQAANEQQHQEASQPRRSASIEVNADIDPTHPNAILANAIGKAQRRRPRRRTVQQPKPPSNGHQAQRPPIKGRQAQRQQRPKHNRKGKSPQPGCARGRSSHEQSLEQIGLNALRDLPRVRNPPSPLLAAPIPKQRWNACKVRHKTERRTSGRPAPYVYRRSCGKCLRAQSGSIPRCVTIPLACPILIS